MDDQEVLQVIRVLRALAAGKIPESLRRAAAAHKPETGTTPDIQNGLPLLCSVATVAKQWSCSKAKIYAMVQTHKLPVVRIEGMVRIHRDEVLRRTQPPAKEADTPTVQASEAPTPVGRSVPQEIVMMRIFNRRRAAEAAEAAKHTAKSALPARRGLR